MFLKKQPPEVLYKKGALKSFAKLTGKHLCLSLVFNKMRLRHRCFPVNFAKFLRTPFFTEHLRAIASVSSWVFFQNQLFRAFFIKGIQACELLGEVISNAY